MLRYRFYIPTVWYISVELLKQKCLSFYNLFHTTAVFVSTQSSNWQVFVLYSHIDFNRTSEQSVFRSSLHA